MKMEKLNAHLRADPMWEDNHLKNYLVENLTVVDDEGQDDLILTNTKSAREKAYYDEVSETTNLNLCSRVCRRTALTILKQTRRREGEDASEKAAKADVYRMLARSQWKPRLIGWPWRRARFRACSCLPGVARPRLRLG